MSAIDEATPSKSVSDRSRAERRKNWRDITPAFVARVGVGMVAAAGVAVLAVLVRWRYGHDGVLAGDRGAYRLVKAPEAIDVPGTVQAILAARIDRLPLDDKDLLQTAAVVGTDIPVAVLAAVSGRTVDALADGLARLQAAEFLYETSLVPDAAYTFKHALTHDVTYGSLLPDRRRALHVRIGEAIETLYPERLAEHV